MVFAYFPPSNGFVRRGLAALVLALAWAPHGGASPARPVGIHPAER